MKKSFLAICFAVLSLGSFAEDKIYEDTTKMVYL